MCDPVRSWRLIGVLMVSSVVSVLSEVTAAPVLRRGEIQMTSTLSGACDVTMTLSVEGIAEIDHRIEVMPGTRIALVDVRGASRVGDLRLVGRTQSLVVRPEASAYQLHYRVEQPDDRRDRCPLWLPLTPTDGRPDAIRIQVDLPPSTIPAGSFPAFTWNGTHGVVMLGHLPAFVRLSYVAAGQSAPWDLSRTMDAVALVAFAAASALWIRFRR